MKTLAIIPIRSGSKRVQDKNVKIIGDYPLFYYQYKNLKEIYGVDNIIISTDSKKYKIICEVYGCKVILRKKECSNDFSTLEDVVFDAFDQLDEVYDLTILVQATSPLTNSNDIQRGLNVIKDNPGINSIYTYTNFKRFFITDNNILERPRTQDMKPRQLETGCFWIFRNSEFLKCKNRIINPKAGIEVSNISSLDIDTYEDLEVIEPLIKKQNRKNNYYFSRITDLNKYDKTIDPDGIRRDLKQEIKNKQDDTKNEVDFINKVGIKGSKFLDLGCGNGLISSFITDDYEKYGIEPDNDSVENSRKYINESNLINSELKFGLFEKEFFDIILCYHVIEHVNNPENFIKIINEILKTRGFLIISTPNFNSYLSIRFKDKFRLLNDQTHIRLFSYDSMRNFLEDNGFYIIKYEFPFFETRHFTQDNLNRLFDTNKISPPFIGNIMSFYCMKK